MRRTFLVVSFLTALIAVAGAPQGRLDVPRDALEHGTFVIEQAGKVLGEEEFYLEKTSTGVVLVSSTELRLPSGELVFHGEVELSGDLRPQTYRLAISAPSAEQTVEVVFSGSGAHLVFRAGNVKKELSLAGDDWVVLDNNFFSHYLLLLPRLEGDRLTALVPQVGIALPVKVLAVLPGAARAGDEKFDVMVHKVALGDLVIRLVEMGGELVGATIPVQRVRAFRREAFPQGFELSLAAEAERPPEGTEERGVRFSSRGIELAGTLCLPWGHGPFPGVVFLHGSGPVDRNGSAPGLPVEVFRQLAWGLAQRGIASLRYDKRGVGGSGGDLSRATVEDLLADAAAAVRCLKGQPEVNPDAVFLVGHSEGAILSPVLATRVEVAGLILLGAAARPLDEVLLWQTEAIQRALGADEAGVAEALERQRSFIRFVKGSQGEWGDYRLSDLRTAMPWLTPEALPRLSSASLGWWRWHFAHDPLAAIREVKEPVLIVNGDKDIQVPPRDAYLLAEAAREAGNGEVEAHVLPDLNHLLRHHPEPPSILYRHLAEPLDPRVVELVADWVLRWALVLRGSPVPDF